MTGQPPTFGPTDVIPADEDAEPFAVVRIALTLTHTQLRDALAIGHAELSGEPPLSDLDILDVRREVEGCLAAGAVFELEREARTARLAPGLVAELDAAINRAYTLTDTTPAMQDPVYGDGTVTLVTEDHGDVTLPEPDWCRGHDDHRPGTYRVDLTHYGTETVLTHQGAEVFRVMVTESPFATRPEHRTVCAYLEQAGHTGEFTPTGLYDLAATLDAHADRLRDFADQLGALLDGGEPR